MKSPTARHYLSLVVSIALNSATLVLLKAVVELDSSADVLTVSALLSLALQPLFVLAIGAFLGGIYFWIIALRRIDLSLAYPSVGLSYGFIAVIAWLVFGEALTPMRILGIALIVGGVSIMHLPVRREENASGRSPRSEA
jgi:drug/metabolite transporter (DMT)-like permease